MISRFSFFHLGILFFSSALWASTFIETRWEPKKSRNGEPIRFSIVVKNSGTEYIRTPEFPSSLADWDIVRSYASPSMRTTIENGKMTVKQENEYTYILAPKKKGTLAIPAVSLAIGSKRHTTAAVKIVVDEVPLDADRPFNAPPARPVPMPTPQQPSIPGMNQPWGQLMPGLPRNNDLLEPPSRDSYDFEIPGQGRQTFFVRAHVKKTNVFLGEMIEVSYRAYTKSRALREAEITKFPEFKGFLKEDLYFPKIFDPQPVMIQGQSFFETELIRYALFPIKEGSLKIDPMNFKLRISNRDSLAESLLYGTPFDGNLGSEIPMEKASESVSVIVKPLPIPVPESFTGAVGNFVLETLSPPGALKTGQPFSLILNITGTGNLKSIEAPKIKFPPEIEVTNIASHPGAMNKDGSGTIQFEYLLTPTKEIETEIAESEWAYFDPQLKQYSKLKTPKLPLKISQGSRSSSGLAKTENTEEQKKLVWSQLDIQSLSNRASKPSIISEPFFWGSHTAFGIHLAVLVFFLTSLWKRRRKEESEAHLLNHPWTKVESLILAKNNHVPKMLAENIDKWMRLRLMGGFKSKEINVQNLHSESTRLEFVSFCKKHLSPEHHKITDHLMMFWAELDQMRFSGVKMDSEIPALPALQKARGVVEPILKLIKKTDDQSYQGFKDEWST